MAKKKGRGRKPSSPEEIAEKRARAVASQRAQLRAEGIDVSVAEVDGVEVSHARQAELEAKGVTVEIDHRRRMKSALAATHHKADIWWRLHSRDALSKQQLNAVRDLQDLMAVRAGIGGRDERMAYERDKVEEPLRDPCLVTDAMLRAGREVDLWLGLVGPPSSRLLTALLCPVALNERATIQKPMRRCAATAERELSTPEGGDRRGAWQKMLHDFDDRKRGRTKPRVAVARRVCETLNEVNAKHCQGCGAPLPQDVKNDKGEIIARPGVEMLAVEEDWRAVVERVTGASHVSSQSELLRFAAQALVDVRPQVERTLKAAGQGKRERRDPQGFAEASAPVRTHPFHAGVGR
jgi:hypothetical protein